MKEIKLSDEQIVALTELATFDGIAIAMEIVEACKILLDNRPGDEDFRRNMHEAFKKAITTLEKLERGQKIIEIFTPILESTKPR